MADDLPLFRVGGSTDDALFRVAGFYAYAVVSGKKWDISAFDMLVELGSLPSAKIQLAVGMAATSEELTVSGIEKEFSRYRPIKIYLEVPQLPLVDSRVKAAIAAGKYVLYDGVVDTRQFVRSAGSLSVEIVCQHKMARLLAGTSVYSPYVPSNLIDLRYLANGGFAANTTKRVEQLSEGGLWPTLVEVAKIVFAPSGKQIPPTVRASKYIKTDKLQPSNEAALALLGTLDNLLTLQDLDMSTRVRLLEYINAMLIEQFSTNNLWAAINSISGDLFFLLVPTVNQVTAIPFYPFFKAETARVVPAGTYFTIIDGEALGADSDMSLVVGTYVVRSVIGGFVELVDPLQMAVAGYLAESRLTPETEGYAVIRLENLPRWVSGTSVLSSDSDKGVPADKALRSSTSPPEETKDLAPKVDAQKLDTFCDRYAKFMTLLKLFSRTRRTIVTGFRLDVMPGQGLCIESLTSDTKSEIIKSYGFVQRVHILVDVTQQQASTTIELGYVRSETDQKEIVDTQPVEHFLWADRTEDLNDLRWSDVED